MKPFSPRYREVRGDSTWWRCWTDGSAYPNPGWGGWAVLVKPPGRASDVVLTGSGTVRETNNTMELLAALKALEYVLQREPSARVRVFSDSAYVVGAFREDWFSAWIRRGWRNSAGKPVASRPLWERLLAVSKKLVVEWVHIPGHRGIPENEQVDQLARMARITQLGTGDLTPP